jgi:ATP-dependent RNA helicase DDX18/HAS1
MEKNNKSNKKIKKEEKHKEKNNYEQEEKYQKNEQKETNDINDKDEVKEKENRKEKNEINDKDDNDINNKKNIIKEENKNDNYFSNIKFSEMNLSKILLDRLNLQGYEIATEVQAKSIPIALKGEDIIGSAKTGSGKSLAFLIPTVEFILKNPKNEGIQALVITPTRELALQLYDLSKMLMNDNGTTCVLVIGGGNRKKEAEKLTSGQAKIIICTPGRLIDHMMNTKKFEYNTIKILIIDEADKILKIGFEEELREIIKLIPKNRQTLLYSATITPKVEDLITLSVKNYENIRIKSEDPTVSTLEQGFLKIDADKKFLFLFTFFKKNKNSKILVFFATCKEVEFYSALLNYVDVPVLSITGECKQQKRSTTFMEFCSLDKGILLCTDVAQRGLDIPDVDWVIQYDPPHDPEEYLHRVGRTARGANKLGKALIMILPNEINFIRMLQLYKIKLDEFQFPEKKLAKVQEQLEKLVNKKDKYLLNLATEAYRAYIHSYNAQTDKDSFDLEKLDLLKVCKSFGLISPPFVHLNIKPTTNSMRRKNDRKKFEFNSRHQRGNSNKDGDERQFVH